MIEDELLRGKAPTLSDLADLLALLSHPRVGETLGGVRSEPAVRQVITRWARLWTVRNLGPWLFRYGETDALIGYAGLAPAPESVEPDSVELLYALRPEFWGRGFATRMSSLALRHAFPTCSTAWPAPADSAATCRVGPSLRCGLRTSRARAKETAIKLQVKSSPDRLATTLRDGSGRASRSA